MTEPLTVGVEGGYRELFDHVSDGLLVHEPDSGVVHDVNDRFVELSGFDRDELVGRRVTDLVADGHPSETAPSVVDEGTVERRMKRRDEEPFWAELSASRIDLSGEPCVLTTVRDVTERRRRRNELARFEELVEHVPTGIFRAAAEPDGTFLEVNPTMVELFDAHSKATLLSTEVAKGYADPTDWVEFLDEAADGGVRTEKFEFRTHTDEAFWGLVTVCYFENADDDAYVDGAIKDVTQTREHQRVLEEQNERLELLNRIVRHDIRNDIQLVEGMTDLLDDAVDEAARPQLETIRSRSQHVIELTDVMGDLMETLLSETGPDLEPTNLSYVLDREVREAVSAYPDATIRIRGNVPLVEVVANDMLGSVFGNLLNNAVQHSDRAEPTVTVTAEADDETATVRIADDGPGIDDDRKETVFGKGEKGLDSEGTGLGLYLVYTLVEEYGGDVWVEDNDPEGSVFVVRLDRA
ncbi:sensor histidine kinase [Haloplanus salilacus]|uniref:sensor histidine kinase n=1 Tax=Haloplanus salilacus TaxID=2949994 RepID=UPI0030D34B25